MKPRWRVYVGMFILFCCWGGSWEWLIGLTLATLGRELYIYPSSPLLYTSLEVLPLWGLAGLQGLTLFSILENRDNRKFAQLGILVLLTLLWVYLSSLLPAGPSGSHLP